jgi:hypothetical protein
MNQPVQPDEAASALFEVRKQQEQVINSVMVPGWYWWVTAALVVGLGGAVDSHRHVVLAVVIPVFVACVAILTGSMIFGGYHRAQVRGSDLLGPRGALAIMTFVWLLVGGVLGVAFALRAEHLRYPATIATAIGAVVLVAGGPVLMHSLRDIMLSNRSAGPR